MYDVKEVISYTITPTDLIYGCKVSLISIYQHFVSTAKSLTRQAKHQHRTLNSLIKQWRTPAEYAREKGNQKTML